MRAATNLTLIMTKLGIVSLLFSLVDYMFLLLLIFFFKKKSIEMLLVIILCRAHNICVWNHLVLDFKNTPDLIFPLVSKTCNQRKEGASAIYMGSVPRDLWMGNKQYSRSLYLMLDARAQKITKGSPPSTPPKPES